MISWHKSKSERMVAKGWHILDEDPFDGWTVKYLEKCICRTIWSPIKYREGIRLESHFLGAMVCALDFDGPDTPLSWARETFKDYDVIIGTTKSHQKPKNGITCDRYRVLLWFKEPITELALYKHNMGLLINKHGADKACKDGARFFFPCVEIVESHGGAMLDIMPLPVAVEKIKTRYQGTKSLSYFGNIQPASTNRNIAVYGLVCDLIKEGFDPYSKMGIIRHRANGLPENEIESAIKSAIKKTMPQN